MIILTRQQANNLSDNLVGIMTEIEDQLLRKIAEQLARDGNISDTSKWRIRQLARMGQLDREALRLIKSYSGVQSEVLYDTLMNAALTEIGYVDAGMREAAAKGLISGDMTIPADRTAENALTAYQKQAQNDLNMVNTVMRYQATAAYTGAVNNIYYQVHNALDTGTATVVTGSESLQSAIRNTIKELSWKGIPAFVDKAGRHWSPEAYVRMDLRTTVGNTARAAQWSRCDNFGVSLIAVDSHPGARPKCAPYQGRIFSRDGSSGVTTDGSGRKITYSPLSSTSYGEPDGLFGINCGHSCYPFIPGVNFQRYFPYDPEENAARYKEFQTQRALEREIRASKRECMMLQAAGDKEGYEKAALRLRTQREKYRVYSNEHGLSMHNDRTQVYGFDRSQSMKAVWAEKKANASNNGLTNGVESGMIKKRQLAQATEFNIMAYDVVEDLPSVESLKKYAADTMGIQYISGIDNLKNGTNAQTVLSTVQELSETYNKHFSRISFIDLGSEKTIAETLGSELRLNLEFMNRPDAVEAVLNEWVNTGYIPKGCNNCVYVAKHEYFHLLSQDSIDKNKSKVLTEIRRQKIPPVSENAKKNGHEYVADLLSANILTKQQQKLKDKIIRLILAEKG